MSVQAEKAGTGKIHWGVAQIADRIERTPRQTNHMLAIGALPGAKKIARRWCITERALLASLENTGEVA